jgi:hypothetical protein
MSLASRNLNSALGALTPTKASNSDGNGTSNNNAATARKSSIGGGDGGGEAEAIRVAVRLKPLSANADYDEIDPQLNRAWRVLPETHTIVQESVVVPDAAFGAAMTTPAKSRFSMAVQAPPSTAGKQAAQPGKETTFTFDRVYGENATTCQIYDGMVKDIVGSVAEKGINGTGEFFP